MIVSSISWLECYSAILAASSDFEAATTHFTAEGRVGKEGITMFRRAIEGLAVIAAIAILVFQAGCGGGGGGGGSFVNNPPPTKAISINEKSASVNAGSSMTFHAVDEKNVAITATWVVSGNAGGTIAKDTGVYTPPVTSSVDKTDTVTATRTDSTAVHDTSVVTVIANSGSANLGVK